MNSLLQTFFLAILLSFLFVSSTEKQPSSTGVDLSINEQETSISTIDNRILATENLDVEVYKHNTCELPETPSIEKKVKSTDTPAPTRLPASLTKSLEKFFLFIEYLTGFEKITRLVISPRS